MGRPASRAMPVPHPRRREAFANVALAPLEGYRLLRRIGQGSQGIVYLALDRSRGQNVALKLIPSLPGAPDTRDRPWHEAQFVGKIQHPHVVHLQATGTYPGGFYLVMEWVAGSSVQSLLQHRRLPWLEATAILEAACRGVRAVHAAGILHCDIKPANLLRTEQGEVKLTDFSLARWLTPPLQGISRHPTGGTPYYMSPEQCREEDCDERSDIYALGATYHTLLTGQTPYARASLFKVLFDQCSAPVPDPRRVDPTIPEACAAIVRRAMAKKRSDRPGCVSTLQEDIMKILEVNRSQAPWQSGLPRPGIP